MHKLSRALKTRYIKTWCPQCHYICRVSRKNLANGSPICPVHIVPMKVQRYKGSAEVTGPDTSIVDKVLEEMRADKEAQLAEWRGKWALEAAARRRTEQLSRQKAAAQSKAEWEAWKADPRNGYRESFFPRPVWEQDKLDRERHDRELEQIRADIEAKRQREHEEYERAEAERWQRLKAKIEAMAAQPAPVVQQEPAQPDPAPRKKTYGRAWIHQRWQENADALTALRKPRVQERLIKHKRGTGNDDAGEIGTKQPEISRTVAPGTAAEDAVDVQVEAKCDIGDEQ